MLATEVNHGSKVNVMEWRERLVDASCAAVNAAHSGKLAEAYRLALTMISVIHEIEFHEGVALGLAGVMEQVVWTERSCSCNSAAPSSGHTSVLRQVPMGVDAL